MENTRLIVKGLPTYVTSDDLRGRFAAFGEVTDCKVVENKSGKSRGFAFVGFREPQNAHDACKYFNQTYIDTSRITVEMAKPIGDLSLESCYSRKGSARARGDAPMAAPAPTASDAARSEPFDNDPEYLEFLNAKKANLSWNEGVPELLEKVRRIEEDKEAHACEEEASEEPEKQVTNRIYVTNLPYDTTVEELEKYFSEFGEVTDVVLPVDKMVNRGKGYGFVTFASIDSVVEAMKKSNIFQGRHLKLQTAEKSRTEQVQKIPDDDEGFQDRKKRLLKVEKPQSWNALFLNKDTVAEAASHMLGFTKAELLNPESDDIASRLTLAEAQLVKTTKELFEKAGIDLSLFEKETTKRSRTLIIVKNLKYQSTEEEIRNLFESYGSLVRFIFPPTHANALVEYARPEDAKRAFQALSFKKVHDQPIYLQWAPATSAESIAISDKNKEYKKPKKETLKQIKQTTLIMKNVPFKATKKELYDIVNSYARVKAIRMPKKADGSGHRGFVFLDFNTPQEAASALENLSDVHLYDRHLVVQPADVGKNIEALQPNK